MKSGKFKAVFIICALATSVACGRAPTISTTSNDASAEAPKDAKIPDAAPNRHGNTKPVCTGDEPARKGAPYTARSSVSVLISAFHSALAHYETEHPEAQEYALVAKNIAGKTCFVDDECSTGSDSKFQGSCLRYVWDGTNGSCRVQSLIDIPLPPSQPKLTCADVTCPSNFQCEVEDRTGAVGCVEQRSCIQPGGGRRGR